jgi:ferrous iron transport protein A
MVTLNDLPVGKEGIVMVVNGGHGLVQKLDAMGIRVGKELIKVSRQWMKGPVIRRSGNTEIAIGNGMAKRIMVNIK